MKAKRKSYLIAVIACIFAITGPAHAEQLAYITVELSESTFTNKYYKNVAVINTETHALASVVPIGDGAKEIAISPDGKLAYVANESRGNIWVIDIASNDVTSIEGVRAAYDIAFTPDSAFAYIANLGSVLVIDTKKSAVIATLPRIPGAIGIAVSSNGKFAYVAYDDGVAVIEVASNKIVDAIEFGTSNRIAITPDGEFAYVTGDGSSVNVIETATNSLISKVSVGRSPFGLDITPDGNFVYVANRQDGTISVISTATNTVVTTVQVITDRLQNQSTTTKVAITPDGAFAYVINGGAWTRRTNSISVIDIASNTVVSTIPMKGNNPTDVAFTPDN